MTEPPNKSGKVISIIIREAGEKEGCRGVRK